MVNAPPSLPPERGPYQIAGADANGNTLFDMRFAMDESVCGEGDVEGGGFVFFVPMRADWSNELARIELSGPGGYVVMSKAAARTTTG